MSNILILLITFLFFSKDLYCQETIFDNDIVLIYPDNVDAHFDAQISFYLKTYQNGISKVQLQENKLQAALDHIELKKKLKKKDKKEKAELGLQLANLNEKKLLLEKVKEAWQKLKGPISNVSFSEQIELDKCYNIVSQDKIYSPEEYRIEESVEEVMYWNEISEIIETAGKVEYREIEKASTKWVKKKIDRSCQSSDCYKWCLIDVPAKFEKFINPPTKECPEGFVLDEKSKNCKKRMKVENQEGIRNRIIDLSSNREIIVSDYKEIECD